ncbi:hypothetical protein D3C81_1556310 [compost metagenome]
MIPNSRIADKAIERTVSCENVIHRVLIVGVAGDIPLHRQHMLTKTLAQVGDFGSGELQCSDPRTLFNKALDQRQAQAGTAAGNKDDVIA